MMMITVQDIKRRVRRINGGFEQEEARKAAYARAMGTSLGQASEELLQSVQLRNLGLDQYGRFY